MNKFYWKIYENEISLFLFFSITKIWTFNLKTGVLRKLVLVTRGLHLICYQQKPFEFILELTRLWKTSHTHSPGFHHWKRTMNTPTGVLRKLVLVIRGVGYNCYNQNILEYTFEWNFTVFVFLYHQDMNIKFWQPVSYGNWCYLPGGHIGYAINKNDLNTY